MQGRLLNSGELKRLPEGARVHVIYEPQSQKDKPLNRTMYVQQADGYCYLGTTKNSTFCMDFTFGKDDEPCSDHGLQIYEFVKKP